jgi:hypothetical protein
MDSRKVSLEARREHIDLVIQRLEKRPQDLYWAIDALKSEPEAKHRRLRSSARINISDVGVFSQLLKQEFPELVYFFANYKTGTPTPSKFSESYPITLYGTLLEATLAAIEVEEDKPAFNGPNFNRPDVFVRWPWPDELVSSDPEILIGGRNFPDDTFRLALQYRDLGRWFLFHYRTNGCVDPRLADREYRPPLLDRSKLSVEAYPDLTVLKGSDSEFFAVYDLNDPETTAFAKRAHALWRRIATKEVSVYDPIAGGVVEPSNWRGRHWRPVGKRALEGALETPPCYADFAFTPLDGRGDGPALMIGPKLRKSKLKPR